MRKYFDTTKACQHVWDVLWANNLATRAKEKSRANSTYYLTAADIVRGVRCVAYADLQGKPWPTKYADVLWGDSYVRMSGDLQSTVRDWLFRNPKLAYHNFGRGHISGARFRPVGELIGPSEVETIERKEKAKDRPKVKHFGRGYGSSPFCVVEARKKKAQRIYGWRQSKAWVTTRKEEVTCPRCKNLLAAGFGCEEVKEIA